MLAMLILGDILKLGALLFRNLIYCLGQLWHLYLLHDNAGLIRNAFDLICDEETVCLCLLVQLGRQTRLCQQRLRLVDVVVPLEVQDVAQRFDVLSHPLLQVVIHLVAEGERSHRLEQVVQLDQFSCVPVKKFTIRISKLTGSQYLQSLHL